MCSGMLELNLYILLNSVKEPTVGCAGKRWPVNYECCSRSSLKGLNINQEVFFATLYLGGNRDVVGVQARYYQCVGVTFFHLQQIRWSAQFAKHHSIMASKVS